MTDRKLNETAVCESEGRLRAIFETAVDGVITTDELGHITTFNRAAAQIFGYEPTEVIGENLTTLMPAPFSDGFGGKLGDDLETAIAPVIGIGREVVARRKDGSQFPMDLALSETKLGAQRIFTGIVRDITQRKRAEEQLRDSKELLSSVLDSSLDGVLMFQAVRDPGVGGAIIDFEYRLVNRAAERLIGREAPSLLGKRLLAEFPGARTTGLFDRYVDVVTTGRPLDIDQFYDQDGFSNWFHVVAVRLGDGLAITFADVTERKQTEETLKDQAGLLDLAHDSILVRDLNSKIVYWNQGAAGLYGWSAQEALGSVTHTLLKTAFPARLEDINAQLFQDGHWEGELIHTRRDGSRVTVASRWAVRKDAEGSPSAILEINSDITEHKWADALIKQSSQRLSLATQSASIGVWEWNVHTGEIIWDATMFELYGVPPTSDSCVDFSLWYDTVLPEDAAEQLKKLQDTVARKGRSEREFRIRRPDGAVRVIQAAEIAQLDNRGEVISVIGVNRDVTKSRRAAEEIQRLNTSLKQRVAELAVAKTRAESADHAKSDLLANMSHEIRTPMNAILGFASLMTSKDTPEAARIEYANIIHGNGSHLLGLINDILDLSKVEAQQITLEQVSTDLPALLVDVASLMRPKADEKGLNFVISFQGPIPKLIHTDPMRLRQILINLIGNAIKFTASGKIGLRILDEGAGGEHIRLRADVTDSGIGMTPVQLEKLFRPFTQADTSIARRFGGTGLGLTISRQLALLLNGDLSVVSETGVGSIFTLKVDGGPSENVELLYELTEAKLPAKVYAQEQSHIHLKGRVLLVEDTIANQTLLRLQLGNAGAEVVIAENGQVGVDLAAGQKFDVILMDMQMPVMDGYSATSELRRRGLTTPILALTASAMAEDRRKCMDCGCSGFITKPISAEVLLKTVDHHIKSAGLPAPVAGENDGLLAA